MKLVSTIKDVHISVNSHNHDRNLIQTGGQRCKTYGQQGGYFLKNPREKKILEINKGVDTF